MGEFEDQVFIAMDFVEGLTLADWLLPKKPGRAQVVEVFLGAAQGLSAAHRVSQVHRDFKPENVLMNGEGKVRLTDFGLARSTPLESSTELKVPNTADTQLAPLLGSQRLQTLTATGIGPSPAPRPTCP